MRKHARFSSPVKCHEALFVIGPWHRKYRVLWNSACWY